MNYAASQRAPLVLVIENNQWAYSTPVARQVPVRNLVDRAKAYGVTGLVADGNDVLAVYQTSKRAVEQCRAGDGPVLIEVKTMRMKGHAQHDPAEYVPKQMFEYWKERDPIAHYEKYLTANKIWNAKAKSEIDARIERELDEDQIFAEESPLPPPELAEQGVYCEGCHTIEAEWKRPIEEVTPPQSSVKAEWTVEDFGGLDHREAEGTSAPAEIGESGNGREIKMAGGGGASAAGSKPAAKPAAKNGSKSKPAKPLARSKGKR